MRKVRRNALPLTLLAALLMATLLQLQTFRSAHTESSLDLVGPLAGRGAPGEWVAYPFPVKAGWTYTIRLEPRSGDADVWLYVDGGRAAVGNNTGLAVEELTWTPLDDGAAVAWVTGFGRGVEYTFAVHMGEVMARGRGALSVRGAAAPAPTQAPRSSASKAQGKVGLQVGHWKHQEAGPPFNKQPGSSGGGKTEAEVNLAIAERAAELLRELGYVVDLLPTAFPSGYRADVVVAIHADGGPSTRRGFFADRFANSPQPARDDRLVKLLNAEHAQATGIPYQYRGTVNSGYYYGYYRVTKETPMALIETGFLTNAEDRAVLIGDPFRVARGVAKAIDRFLSEGS